MVYSDGQSRVLEALELKIEKHNYLFQKLNDVINSQEIKHHDRFKIDVKKPLFL